MPPIQQTLCIKKMDETADGPKGDQGPESGHGGLEKNIFPVLAKSGGNEGPREQDK